jgi:uncharacterized protein YjbJ (UPF0337 family)
MRNHRRAAELSLHRSIPEKEGTMGSTTDKIKGMTNEAVGNVKQSVGKAVGSDKLQAEGLVQEIKGDTQQAIGKAKEDAKKAADKAAERASDMATQRRDI